MWPPWLLLFHEHFFGRKERRKEICPVRSALYCLLMPTHHKVKVYKKAKFYKFWFGGSYSGN